MSHLSSKDFHLLAIWMKQFVKKVLMSAQMST
ncbi:hypothetical protein ALQ74_200094 [Pseudomonas savastanoi pv. glycinea]|uniref:Uncharacterized protein n=1 Tax=Pseudomonas savastanoi pv. glycinea TaxID=318 RepID=A0A3M3FI76_PSESG|nr:hypothetical protein ALQ74_200094 [Pseudomonas savastanoi pv. glycinea]